MLEQADLGSRILPTLTALAARTGETSSLAVLDHDSAMIIQRVASDRALKADIKTGTRMTLETSASGRVLIAFCAKEAVEDVRRSGATMPSTEIVDEARRQGFAAQHDEYLRSVSSIAVPIHSTKLGVIALAITAPSTRYDEAAALQALEAGAVEIELLLR